MSVTGLDHLVLTVDDVDASVAFYRAALADDSNGHVSGNSHEFSVLLSGKATLAWTGHRPTYA
jgi:catechol 2,3-dioxygenase-like lactoylglutathione lyase family enzyme